MNLKPNVDFSKFEGCFTAVDSHTVGEFTRVIVSGVPDLKGSTMIEKKNYFMEHHDNIRTSLMYEPRGHRDMFGSIVTEPISKEADFGIFFLETSGILNMCVHGTVGTTTALIEAKLVPVTEPYTEIVYDAPAGLIRARAKVVDGHAVEVSVLNVPSFLYKEHLTTEIEGQTIHYDLSFGGSFFVMVDADQFGPEIGPQSVNQYIDLGMKILGKVNEDVEISHPVLDITTADLCEFYSNRCSNGCDIRNVVVFGNAQADRSPCGTGTSAKIATLFARKEMNVGDSIINESFIGTRFKGKVMEETTVGPYKAIIPEITGSAYITGVATYLIDSRDPLKDGFLIG